MVLLFVKELQEPKERKPSLDKHTICFAIEGLKIYILFALPHFSLVIAVAEEVAFELAWQRLSYNAKDRKFPDYMNCNLLAGIKYHLISGVRVLQCL
jgi:hypothetical protein